jgi:hypothetical protein
LLVSTIRYLKFFCEKYFQINAINLSAKGADTPDTNITKAISVTIVGSKYKANAVQAARQEAQLNGLKSNFHLTLNLCISTKNKAKQIAVIIIIVVFFSLILF